jgi:hypothetical protein
LNEFARRASALSQLTKVTGDNQNKRKRIESNEPDKFIRLVDPKLTEVNEILESEVNTRQSAKIQIY